eukprot:10155692-Heterocapsa_arctica.AAC.1
MGAARPKAIKTQTHEAFNLSGSSGAAFMEADDGPDLIGLYEDAFSQYRAPTQLSSSRAAAEAQQLAD